MKRRTPDLPTRLSSGLPLNPRGKGREYRAYPSLSSARWLFPVGPPAVRRAGIKGLFHPSSAKGRILQRAIFAGLVPGGKVFLGGDAMARLEDDFARALGVGEVRVAFYLGVPGAYRKITVQVTDPDGETLAFAKIATSPTTERLIDYERGVLLRLGESGGLRGRVPEVLHAFDWQGSRTLLITDGPSRPGPGHLSEAHLELCTRIFLPFARRMDFGESPMMERMSRRLSEVGPRLPGPLLSLLNRALGLLGDELGTVSLPVSLSHGDFAPWNTRIGPSGLFVFDWDGAQDGTAPLYDIFHFQAIQAALLDRQDHLPDRSFLRDALAGLWPEGQEHLPWLYLSYLLDMNLFYGEARMAAPDVGDERVWNWFGGRIESFLEDGPPL